MFAVGSIRFDKSDYPPAEVATMFTAAGGEVSDVRRRPDRSGYTLKSELTPMR